MSLNLTRTDKYIILKLLEDKIRELYSMFLDIIRSDLSENYKKNSRGILILIRDYVAVLEKISKDLHMETKYNSEWYKLLKEF
jgi:hypothetical protein